MQLTSHCYSIIGFGYIPPWTVNSGFIVGNEKTLVCDTGPNSFAAETIFGYATAVNPSNKIIALNLEKHLDHVGGNSLFFEKGVELWGHYGINRTPKDLEDEIEEYNNSIIYPVRKANKEASLIYTNTFIKNPTHRISDHTTFDLGGLQVKVLFTPGHTDTNISAYAEKEGVLFCADCITNGYIPNLEAGGVEDWKTWLDSLNTIEAIAPNIIVPGHGPVIGKAEIKSKIERVRIYLSEAIERGIPPTVENH